MRAFFRSFFLLLSLCFCADVFANAYGFKCAASPLIGDLPCSSYVQGAQNLLDTNPDRVYTYQATSTTGACPWTTADPETCFVNYIATAGNGYQTTAGINVYKSLLPCPAHLTLNSNLFCSCPTGQYDTGTACVVDPCAGQPDVIATFPMPDPNTFTSPNLLPQACGNLNHNQPNDCAVNGATIATSTTCTARYSAPSAMEQTPPGTPQTNPPPNSTPNMNPDGTPISTGGGGGGGTGTVDCTLNPTDPSCPTGGTGGGGGGGGTTTVDCTLTPTDPACTTTTPPPTTNAGVCQMYPNSAMCADFGSGVGTEVLTEKTIDVSGTAFTAFSFAGAEACPAPKYATLSIGAVKVFDYSGICSFVLTLRPIVLALAAFIAAMVFMGYRNVGGES